MGNQPVESGKKGRWFYSTQVHPLHIICIQVEPCLHVWAVLFGAALGARGCLGNVKDQYRSVSISDGLQIFLAQFTVSAGWRPEAILILAGDSLDSRQDDFHVLELGKKGGVGGLFEQINTIVRLRSFLRS